MDELDLPSEDAAALVDLLDGELGAMKFRHAHEREIAGDVFEQTDLQRRIGRLGGNDRRRSKHDAEKRSFE